MFNNNFASRSNPLQSLLIPTKQPTKKEPWDESTFICEAGVFAKEIVEQFENYPSLNESEYFTYFRGQSDEKWTLRPSMYRIWNELYENSNSNHKIQILKQALIQEYNSIEYFQQRAFKHLDIARTMERKLSDDTMGEWLALMQHYHAPTRLLDWTASFYVALYFAAQDDRTDGAVWLFYPLDIEDDTENASNDLSLEDAGKVFANRDNFIEYGLDAPREVQTFDSKIKTDRIISQRSIFTVSRFLFSDHAFDLGKILFHSGKVPLTKFVIPKTFKKAIRSHLCKLNLTSETLFLSIESIGATITEKIQLYRDKFLIPHLDNNP